MLRRQEEEEEEEEEDGAVGNMFPSLLPLCLHLVRSTLWILDSEGVGSKTSWSTMVADGAQGRCPG